MSDRLPDHAPVLVDQYNVGHRPLLCADLRPGCGTGLPLTRARALQAAGWSTMPCVAPECWRGVRPW